MSGRVLKGPEFKPTLDKISVGEFFFNIGEKHKDKICQIDGDSDKSETYKSVKERSIRLAINLQKRGITSKDVICICSYNSLDNAIPLISSWYLGAKVANLDPTLTIRNTKHLLKLVKPTMIFVIEESLKLIEDCLNDAKLTSEIVVFGETTKYLSFYDLTGPCDNEDEFRPSKVDVRDIALMLFSSGTTGLPKAICHSHFSFLLLAETVQNYYLSDCVLHFTTFYWISGVMMLFATYLDGGIRVFARTMKGEATFKMIEKYKLTSLFAAPIYTYELTTVPNPEKYDVSSFRRILTGGTPMGTDQYKKLSVLFPKVQIIFGYGMSELGMVSVFHPVLDQHLFRTKIGSCGRVIPGITLKVVNPDTEEILGLNQKGEIRLKTDTIMVGYYQQDSASCFDEDGFLKTGDVGYYDEDDCIYVIERIKEMFKYRSWHIVPSSIEAVLLEHPAIKESVVFGIPKGEEGEVPAACVVLKENYEDVDKEEIEKFVAERVSDNERLRGGVMIVAELTRTPTGKLARREMKNIVIKSM